MPNIKSQKKRVLTNSASNAKNSAKKNEIRTAIKKVELAVKEANKEEAEKALRHAVSLLDRAAQEGIYAKNTVARKKAQLQAHVASIA